MEKNGEWISPGTIYTLNNPQLPEEGSCVKLHLKDGRVIETTFKRDGYECIDSSGNVWKIFGLGVSGWSI